MIQLPPPNHRFEPTAMSLQLPIHLQRLAVPHPYRLVSGKGGQRLLTWSLGPKLLVDTVSTVLKVQRETPTGQWWWTGLDCGWTGMSRSS